MKYLKSSARLLDRNCVNKNGLEVLWVSVGQRAAEIPIMKNGGLKKNSADQPSAGESGSNRLGGRFFLPLTLTAGSSATL